MKKIVIAALSLGLGFMPLLRAAEEHEHHEGKAEKIPDTVAGIWSEVKEHEEELGRIIADKKLDKVHEAAFEIRDMVNALPDKSKDLAADKLAKVKTNAKYVADIAKRLDESGDANDQAATEANFKKLQAFLKTIEAQYPPETLKPSEGEKAQGYTCTMCGGSFDKPGKCPKCGMTLVAKTAEPHS
jgi:rubrerythrin